MKEVADFKIRPAGVDDVPVILELIRDLATYERAPHEVTATEQQLVDVLFGERPAAEVLLVFEEESPVGFAVYFYNFSTWLGRPGLYLEDLFVKPEKRGKGYGRALLVALAKIARDRGCGRMEWAVLDWNEPAIKFYRALGAKPMDHWTVLRLTRRCSPDRFHAAAWRESGHHPHHRGIAWPGADADGTDHPFRLRADRAVGAET